MAWRKQNAPSDVDKHVQPMIMVKSQSGPCHDRFMQGIRDRRNGGDVHMLGGICDLLSNAMVYG